MASVDAFASACDKVRPRLPNRTIDDRRTYMTPPDASRRVFDRPNSSLRASLVSDRELLKVPVTVSLSFTGTSSAPLTKSAPREKYPPAPYTRNLSNRRSAVTGIAHCTRPIPAVSPTGAELRISSTGTTASPNLLVVDSGLIRPHFADTYR